MAHDYIEDALQEHYFLDKMFYECLQEQFEYESEFMLLALENNIILEAEIKNNIENFWDKFLEAINKLYEKFKTAILDLVNGNQKFIETKLSKIPEFDFSSLRIENTIPYWKNTTLDQSSREIEKIMKHIRNRSDMPKPDEIQNFTSTANVEKYGEFGKFLIDGKSFAESIKIKFLYGLTATEPFEPLKELAGEDFKNACINNMLPYVTNYRKTLSEVTRSTNILKTEVNRIKRTKSTLKEAYCNIEEAFYKDTDLFYCINHELLFEAEGETAQNTNQQSSNTTTTSDESKTKNKVVNTEKTPEGKTDSNYEKYLCSACKIINLAIAAQMTSKETIYKTYMQILKNVYKAKKPEKEPTDTKTDETKTEETKKETTDKKE